MPGRAQVRFIYELFPDEKGEKISKSKGNGLTIEQWLEYGSEESLSFYIFPNPKSAKQLHGGVIPRAVDDYWQFRERLAEQDLDKQLGNPVWHFARANGGFATDEIGSEAPGAGDSLPVTYATQSGRRLGRKADREQVWSYLGNYTPIPTLPRIPSSMRWWTTLAYNRGFVAPSLVQRKPAANEAQALERAGTAKMDGSTLPRISRPPSTRSARTSASASKIRDWFERYIKRYWAATPAHVWVASSLIRDRQYARFDRRCAGGSDLG